MKTKNHRFLSFWVFSIVCIFALLPNTQAQSYTNWYENAQERIDTLRKGYFGIQIVDKNGQAYSGTVSVKMEKHEFPFGIAFDFYEGTAMGNSYSTQDPVTAESDSEIYQTERWSSYLGYDIPVVAGKECKVNLKFAEIYFNADSLRLFDVKIDGQLFLKDFDVYSQAGGKNIAKDTSITFMATNEKINIEFIASLDAASIKGIEVDQVSGTCLKINCGGPALITSDGNQYVTENGYFAPNVNAPATKEQWMQAAMYKYFNYGVSGNSFKWSGIQAQHVEPNYTNFDNAVRWTQKVGWDLRAHTLLWGKDGDHEMPNWVRQLPTPKAITDTCEMRVTREMTRYKGIIKEYDVINEPLSDHADWLRNTVGDSIIWNCFKWAHAADPDAQIYINDYNVELNWGQAEEYRDLVLKIKEKGGPISGIGIQAHFWDCCRPNVDEVVRNFNILAETGLPLRLTEYDWGKDLTEKQQVDDFVMVATIAFSHPSVNGMICWALSDIGAWRENSGFFDSTYRPKLAADTLLYLTKKRWATNFDSEITAENPLNFNAYYGKYNIEVAFGDTVKVFSIDCLKENADSVFTLYEASAELKGPQLLSTQLESNDAVILTFDKPLTTASIKKSDFKFFSNYSIGIDDIQLNEENPKELTILLTDTVTKGDYISVSYFPGMLEATDGSKATAFGPEGIYNPAPEIITDPDYINSSLSGNLIKIYPIPATNNLNIDSEFAPYQVRLFNIVGAELYSEVSNANLFKMDVSKYKKGIYLIKITDSKNNENIQKIIIK